VRLGIMIASSGSHLLVQWPVAVRESAAVQMVRWVLVPLAITALITAASVGKHQVIRLQSAVMMAFIFQLVDVLPPITTTIPWNWEFAI
jgi:hypothetical protein